MVGILAHQILEAEVVGVFLGVILEVQHDLGATYLAVDVGDGEFALAFRAPFDAGILGQVGTTSADAHLIGDDEARIETDAKLTDQACIFLLLAGKLLEKVGGAALGDGAEVLDHVITAHANAVVANGDGAGLGIVLDLDAQFAVTLVECIVIQRLIAQLVAGIGSVGNHLTQEDLPVGVQGVNHQIQQLFDFGLEAQGFFMGDGRHVTSPSSISALGAVANGNAPVSGDVIEIWGSEWAFQACRINWMTLIRQMRPRVTPDPRRQTNG